MKDAKTGSLDQPDPTLFFTTDPAYGALLDRNGDGVADDLRVYLAVTGSPPPSAWVALIDLAARLGLETGGIAFPVAVAGAAVATSEGPLLRCVPKENQQTGAGGWALWDAAAVRALARAGLDGAAGDASGGDAPPPPPDLARFYEPDGPALADDDGDLFADRLRLCPVVPPNLP
ncbi:MAG: hypothetical protein ACTHMR_04810, partial [Thermomicrobiales bacterium]